MLRWHRSEVAETKIQSNCGSEVLSQEGLSLLSQGPSGNVWRNFCRLQLTVGDWLLLASCGERLELLPNFYKILQRTGTSVLVQLKNAKHAFADTSLSIE